MHNQTKVTGVILAGGLARRMGGKDKGLMQYSGQPMVLYALQALKPVVDEVLINANRNQQQYQQFGFPVIADQSDTFDGPLAGILSAMLHSDADILLVTPCDSPLVKTEHLQKLLDALASQGADIAVAFDGKRLHPVFLAVKRCLHASLEAFLSGGERKIDIWLQQHHMVQVDFSDNSEIFLNINSLDELSDMESRSIGC